MKSVWILSSCPVFASVCVQFEAKKRVSAEDALRQSYFRSLGEQVQTLADSEYTQSYMLNMHR